MASWTQPIVLPVEESKAHTSQNPAISPLLGYLESRIQAKCLQASVTRLPVAFERLYRECSGPLRQLEPLLAQHLAYPL